MKIIQISVIKSGDFTNIYGLGDNGKLYVYLYKGGAWREWKQTPQ